MIELLIVNGADCSLKNKSGHTPLYGAKNAPYNKALSSATIRKCISILQDWKPEKGSLVYV